MILAKRCSSLVEGDSVVVPAELGGVGAHEHVSDDDVLEVVRKVGAHNAHDALGVAEDGLLKNVVSGSEDVVCRVEGEGNVGQGVEVGAVLFNSDAFKKWLEEFVGSHDERGTAVDGSLVASDVNVTVGAGHLGEVQVPVGLLDNLVGCDLFKIEVFVDAWHRHVGLFGIVMHVECE